MIDPAKPPFPRLKYFPLQPETGIQTSTLISESLDGLISAVTRQKAGRRLNAPKVSSCWSNGPAGRVDSLEATVCADVTVVSSSFRLLSFSQERLSARSDAIALGSASSDSLASRGPGRGPQLARFWFCACWGGDRRERSEFNCAPACTALRPSEPDNVTTKRIRAVAEVGESIFPSR